MASRAMTPRIPSPRSSASERGGRAEASQGPKGASPSDRAAPDNGAQRVASPVRRARVSEAGERMRAKARRARRRATEQRPTTERNAARLPRGGPFSSSLVNDAGACDAVVQELAIAVDERPQEIEREKRERKRSDAGGAQREINGERPQWANPCGEITAERDLGGERASVLAYDGNSPGPHRQRAPAARPGPTEVKAASREHKGKRKDTGGQIGDAERPPAGPRTRKWHGQKSDDKNHRGKEQRFIGKRGETARERGSRAPHVVDFKDR